MKNKFLFFIVSKFEKILNKSSILFNVLHCYILRNEKKYLNNNFKTEYKIRYFLVYFFSLFQIIVIFLALKSLKLLNYIFYYVKKIIITVLNGTKIFVTVTIVLSIKILQIIFKIYLFMESKFIDFLKFLKKEIILIFKIYVASKFLFIRVFGFASIGLGFFILFLIKYTSNYNNDILPMKQISEYPYKGNVTSSILTYDSDNNNDSSIFNEISSTEIKFTKKYKLVDLIEKKIGLMSNLKNLGNSFNKLYKEERLADGRNVKINYIPDYGEIQKGRIISLEVTIDAERAIKVVWNEEKNRYESKIIREKLFAFERFVSGRISNDGVYKTMKQLGVGQGAIREFIEVFSYDIDFQRDIRRGDKFEIGYVEYMSKDNVLVKTGDIKFAEFENRGVSKRYYRFVDSAGNVGYYDNQGRSNEKSLMRSPIAGSFRVTSGFGFRVHPVLGYSKLHTGVDFAAPRNTPIYAAGDGIVEFAGRRGSYGIHIVLRHTNNYNTTYSHMNGLAKGIRIGTRVNQKDIIGYLGATGRVTGPHLHYEVHINRKAINPRKIVSLERKSIKENDLKLFKFEIRNLLKGGV